MKRLVIFVALALVLAWSLPAFALPGVKLSGPHWQVNIIGVPQDKLNGNFDNPSRGTIFVPLNKDDQVSRKVKIYYQAGTEFAIIDGNATDDNVAIIQVPSDPIDWNADLEDFPTLSYLVYAVGLGTPNGQADVDVICTWETGAGKIIDADANCNLGLNSFTIKRNNPNKTQGGPPKVEDITPAFLASGCFDLTGDGICNAGDVSFSNVWVFNIPELIEYYWDYNNQGLKVMQVRFYQTVSGTFEYVQ